MSIGISEVYDALIALSDTVVTTHPHQVDTPFSDQWGWSAPAVGRHEAAALAGNLAEDLKQLEIYPNDVEVSAAEVIRRITHLQSVTVPYMYNGNIGQAYPAYAETLQSIRKILLPQEAWATLDRKMLPSSLVRKVVAAQGRLTELEETIPGLAQKIVQINAAHEVADNLEIDLQALSEARDKVEKAAKDSSLKEAKIENLLTVSAESLALMKERAEVALKLVAQCEEAYHITTTKGLAGAFDQRAISLRWSMRGWVLGLSAALLAGSLIGAAKLESLSLALSVDNPKWPLVISQILISLIGVGAPVWFAWLATKQIGQRFRLAEDYAFKASVSKAYEGYRKEAAILDPDFQATLFRSALTRLDEAPLRLVEAHQSGSPLQDFVNSEAVKNALRIAPDLPSKLMILVNSTLQQAKRTVGETAMAAKGVKASAPSKDDADEER